MIVLNGYASRMYKDGKRGIIRTLLTMKYDFIYSPNYFYKDALNALMRFLPDDIGVWYIILSGGSCDCHAAYDDLYGCVIVVYRMYRLDGSNIPA